MEERRPGRFAAGSTAARIRVAGAVLPAFIKQDGKFLIRTAGMDGKPADFPSPGPSAWRRCSST
jgi:hypothetical protein